MTPLQYLGLVVADLVALLAAGAAVVLGLFLDAEGASGSWLCFTVAALALAAAAWLAATAARGERRARIRRRR